jgi:hypothetical protein
MQNKHIRRLERILILAGLLMFAAWPAHPILAQTAGDAQFAAIALSSADLPGFHLVSEQDVPVQPSDPVAGAWQRMLAADDAAGTAGAAMSIILMVPKDSASTSILDGTVDGGSVFSNLNGVTNLQLTGPLGIGDADQSATWQQWDSNAGAWATFSADNFLHGRLLVAVIYGSDSDANAPSQLSQYARLQENKLIAAGVPTGALSAAAPAAAVAAPGTASAILPAVPGAVAVPTIIVAPSTETGLTLLPVGSSDAPAASTTPDTEVGAVLTRCKDGSVSRGSGPGICSGHGGTAR